MTAFNEVLATVRQTAAAHASALDELERVLTAQTAAVAADHEAFEAERVASHQHPNKSNSRYRQSSFPAVAADGLTPR